MQPDPPAPALERPQVPAPVPPTGPRARTEANLAALATARQVESRGGIPTPQERATIALWSGWGAVPQLFDHPRFTEARQRLLDLADERGYDAARRSTINAHYTAPDIAAQMWRGLAATGFTGGTVLEPGCGGGSFLATAPDTYSTRG